MDSVVCVGKCLKEGGSEDPDDIFMAQTDLTVRAAFAERLRQSVLQYKRPALETHFRLRGAEATAAIAALADDPKADYPDKLASESTTGVGPCYAALKRDTKSECVKKILTFAKATRKEYLAHDVSRPTISYELCNCCHV